MSLTAETVKTLDDQVREIGKYLEMEFDQEYADRQERSWNYHAEIKSGNKRISFSVFGLDHFPPLKNQGRFFIRGEFPKDKKGQVHNGGYNVKTPEITVAMDRGAEKIAKAIQGRLMPEYELQLAVALERIEESDAYHEDRLQILKTVAEYFGQPAPKDDDAAIYPPGGHEKLGFGIYKIEATSDELTFDVSTTIKKALQIFDVLKMKVE